MKIKVLGLLTALSSFVSNKQITMALLIANLCVLTMYVSGWSSSKYPMLRSQDNKKIVEKHFAPKNEPVEIIMPQIKGIAVKLGEAFEEETDWLKQVTFKVKNKSDKPITFFHVDLDFPETKATGNIMMHQLLIGQHPDARSTLKNPPLFLKPNESIEISLEAEYSAIKRLIELRQTPVENISKLVIRLGDVTFADGTVYSGGNIFKRNPDPNSPRKWVQVDVPPTTPQ